MRTQEPNICKKTGYEFYCEELFVVKHKAKYSCKSAIYFDLSTDIIKENCDFQYYVNNADVKPSILNGGHEIVLANWPNTKHVICNNNHNIPIKIPSHPYVLLNRTILCNCGIEVEDNFLLGSITACPGKQSALTIYYTVNTSFMYYFDSSTDDLETHISQNWTMQEQVLPITLQAFEFDSKLLKAPKTLKDRVYEYKQKRQILNKRENNNSKHSFLNNLIMDIFLFVATILSMIAIAATVHIVCKHAKLKALVTGIAFRPIKQTEAIIGNGKEQHKCVMQWYTIAALTLMIIGLIIFILSTTQKCRIFKRRLYSSTVTVMLFFLGIKQYFPVKLCKTIGNIHLFQIYGQLTPHQITLERKLLWDIVRIDWNEVSDFEWDYNTIAYISQDSNKR